MMSSTQKDKIQSAQQNKTVFVWDFPTRLFHWLLVISIFAQYITGEILDDAITWHFYLGYFSLGLILFRLLWGFIGSFYSKFNSFLVSPKKAWDYLSGKDKTYYLGHNPAGAYSILLLLGLVSLQGISGLFISDEIFSDGPYFSAVSESFSDIMNTIHHNAYKGIFAAVVLHILAIIWYRVVRKEKLTRAMLNGKKELVKQENLEIGHKASEHKKQDAENEAVIENTKQKTLSDDRLSLILRFVFAVTMSALLVYIIVDILPPEPVTDFYY